MSQEKNFKVIFNNCHLLMTLMIGLHHFFLEMSKKCWPRFRVRNSTPIRFPCFKAYFLEVTVGCKKTGTVRIKLTHFYNFSIV
jgi:hypothetical protein